MTGIGKLDSYNILLADNEVSNLKALARTLRNEYNIFSATNGEDIFPIMEENDVSVVVANYRMPGITDFELIEKASQRYTDTIYIVLGAYNDDKVLAEATSRGRIYGYVTKPWEPEEIKAVVKEGIEIYELNRATRQPNTRVLLDNGVISKEQLEAALRIQRNEEKPLEEILLKYCIVSKNQIDMALKLREDRQKRLEEVLLDIGAISDEDLKTAYEMQKYDRRKLTEILIGLGYATEESIYSCYAVQLGMPYISLSQLSGKVKFELLPLRLAHKHTIVPIDLVGQVLVIAALEPFSEENKSEIEGETGYKAMAVYAPCQEIKAVLETQCNAEQQRAIQQKHEETHEVIPSKIIELVLDGSIRFQQTNDKIECTLRSITEDYTEITVFSSDPRICRREEVELIIFLPVTNTSINVGGRIIWNSEEDLDISNGRTGYLARVSNIQIGKIERRKLDIIIAQKKALIGG